MDVIIRKFNHMHSVPEAARRAASGIGQMLTQSSGFRDDSVFDGGNGLAGSVPLFDSREAALAASEKALAWIRASLAELVQGEPEIMIGEVLAYCRALTPGRDRFRLCRAQQPPWPRNHKALCTLSIVSPVSPCSGQHWALPQSSEPSGLGLSYLPECGWSPRQR